MAITIYGVVLIGYALFVCLRSTNVKKIFIEFFALSIFLYLNISIGYVLKFGEQTIAGYFLMMLLTAIAAFPFFTKMGIKRFKIVFGFLITIAISTLFIVFMEYQIVDRSGWDYYLFGADNITTCKLDGWHIKELTKILIFVIIVDVARKILDESDWKYIINKVIRWTKVVLCYGVFEFVCVYFFQISNLYNSLLFPVFGLKDSTFTSAISRGDGFQLQGLTTEPSVYVKCLVIIILLFLVQSLFDRYDVSEKKHRAIWPWIGLCLVLMVVSMSFSSILYLSMLAVIIFLYIYKEAPKYRSILLFSVGFILFFCFSIYMWLLNSETYYGERLKSAIYIFKMILVETEFNRLWFHVFEVAADGSTISRLGSSMGILKLEFVQNPIFGLGIGTGNSHALIPNMLTDMGVIGFIYWLRLVFNKEKRTVFVCMAYIVIAMVGFFTAPISYSGADAIVLVYIIEKLLGKNESRLLAHV